MKNSIFFALLMFFSIQHLVSMNSPSLRTRRIIYKHSPGVYRREFSPQGTTLYIIKNYDDEEKTAQIKLSKEMQQKYQAYSNQNLNQKDIYDQIDQKFCNK